tara:strand:- start:9856 stop:10344 length:489 start_codon:yes stop_codon:yes gene_type:complete
MTYFRSISTKANISTAIILPGTNSTNAANGVFSLSGTTTSNSSISSNQLTLSAGYHFYLEGSVLLENQNRDGAASVRFYDVTNSNFVGQSAFFNFVTSFASSKRISRKVARYMHVNTSSDVIIELRFETLSGTNWITTIDSVGIGNRDYTGYPSLRIWEITA